MGRTAIPSMWGHHTLPEPNLASIIEIYRLLYEGPRADNKANRLVVGAYWRRPPS